jgi:hypothetical protein
VFQKIIQLLKKWFSIPKFVLLVVLFFLTLLIGVWNSLPFFLEWGVKGAAKDNGFPDFKMKVSQLDPWKTKILNLATGSDQNLLEISQIDILYDPASVALGEINAISLSGISAQVEIEENILNTKGSSNESSFTENFDLIQNFLSNPPLSYLRIRDSSITLLDNNKSRKVHFLAKIDFLENLTHFLWEADYNSTSITGEFNLSREENSTFASTQMEITDTAGLIGEVFSDERLSKVLPKQLKFSTGNIKLDGFTRVVSDGFKDIFLELNGTDFSVGWGDYNISIPKSILFITPESINNWIVNSYLNLRNEDNLEAEEIHLKVAKNGAKLDLDGGVRYLKTNNKFPPLELHGLRIPTFNFDMSNLAKIPYGAEKKFSFNELSYDDNFFRLYNGVISFLFTHDQNVNLRMFPIDAALLDLGISFVQFSYFGMVDIDKFPQIQAPQTISGRRVISGDEVLLEDLALIFRVQDLSHFLIDMLTLTLGETIFDMRPANIAVEVPENDFGQICLQFNKTSLVLPKEGISIFGLDGEVRFNSLAPLETNGSQKLIFESCQIGDIEIEDGNLSFQILQDGSFLINRGVAKLYDGEIGFSESRFNLFADDMLINTVINKMNGQEIANLLEGIDLDINGTFSGQVPFSNQGGNWDFQGGFLQLDPNANAKLSYKSNGFLTNGINEESEEFKRMQMTEMALENLELDSLRLSFEVDGQERQILGSIRGKSIIKKNTEVSLDYRPKIIAGLSEIMHKLNLKKLGL